MEALHKARGLEQALSTTEKLNKVCKTVTFKDNHPPASAKVSSTPVPVPRQGKSVINYTSAQHQTDTGHRPTMDYAQQSSLAFNTKYNCSTQAKILNLSSDLTQPPSNPQATVYQFSNHNSCQDRHQQSDKQINQHPHSAVSSLPRRHLSECTTPFRYTPSFANVPDVVDDHLYVNLLEYDEALESPINLSPVNISQQEKSSSSEKDKGDNLYVNLMGDNSEGWYMNLPPSY